MRRLAKVALVLVVLLIAAVGALFGISERGGEIVVLRTHAASGEMRETRLWVVDIDGTPWLRAGRAEAGWYQRLQVDPRVELVRAGVAEARIAHPDPAARDTVNARMRERYGFADRLLDPFRDPAETVPVRLDLAVAGAQSGKPG